MPNNTKSKIEYTEHLVSSFYAFEILKFITVEIRDNVDTQFSTEHLLAQADLIGVSLEEMMKALD